MYRLANSKRVLMARRIPWLGGSGRLGQQSTRTFSYTTFDRLVGFKKAILHDVDLHRYEGIPEPNSEFSQNREVLDTTIEIGKQMLSVGKVPYRWVSNPSYFYQAKLSTICEGKSPSQIRRILKSWVVEPDREKAMDFVGRKLEWDSSTGDSNFKLVYDRDDVISYSHYLMSARYAIAKRVLQEIRTLLPEFVPRTVLDFGSGPGTCFPAVLEAFDSLPTVNSSNMHENDRRTNATTANLRNASIIPNRNSLVKKYVAVDTDPNMLSAAKIMAAGTGIESAFFNRSGELIPYVSKSDLRFDLITAAYVFSEMNSDAARKAAAQMLVELLDVNGCLVIIEAGNAEGSHTVRTARQFILDTFNKKSNDSNSSAQAGQMMHAFPPPINRRASVGTNSNSSKVRYNYEDLAVSVVAPCTHDKPCPMGKTICTFSQKVHTGVIRIGSEEKYSYVVIHKSELNPPTKGTSAKDGLKKLKVEDTPSLWKDPKFRQALGRHAPVSENRKTSSTDEVDQFAIPVSEPWFDKSIPVPGTPDAALTPSMLNIIQQLVTVLDDEPDETFPTVADRSSDLGRADFVPSHDIDDKQMLTMKNELGLDDREFTMYGEQLEVRDDGNDDNDNNLDSEDEDFDDDDSDFESDKFRRHQESNSVLRSPNLRRRAEQLEKEVEESNRPISKMRRQFPALDDLLSELESNMDWKNETLPLYRQEWSRVLRPPLKKPNQIELEVCHPTGTIRTQIISRSKFHHVPSLFEALHRTTWGGLLPAFGYESTGPTDDGVITEIISSLARTNSRAGAPGVSQRTRRSIESFDERRAGHRKIQSPTRKLMNDGDEVKDAVEDDYSDDDNDDEDNDDDDDSIIETDLNGVQSRARGSARRSISRSSSKFIHPEATPSDSFGAGTYMVKGGKTVRVDAMRLQKIGENILKGHDDLPKSGNVSARRQRSNDKVIRRK